MTARATLVNNGKITVTEQIVVIDKADFPIGSLSKKERNQDVKLRKLFSKIDTMKRMWKKVSKFIEFK